MTTTDTSGVAVTVAIVGTDPASTAEPVLMTAAISGRASARDGAVAAVLAERTAIGAVRWLRGIARKPNGSAAVSGSADSSGSAAFAGVEVLGTPAPRTERVLRTARVAGESAERVLTPEGESAAELDDELLPCSASATGAPATAEPIPSATANAPTRPM